MKNRKKTILFVTPYFPPDGGGAERYALEIASGLKNKHGWNVYFLTTSSDRGKNKISSFNGMTIYRLVYSVKLSNTPFSFGWLVRIPKILREIKPDVINIHTPVPGLGNIVAALSGKTPVIVTYHAASMRKGKLIPDLFVSLYERIFLPVLLRRAASIVCSSDFVRQKFLNSYRYKSTTITPGVDTHTFVPGLKRKSSRPTILFVGGLSRSEQYKGLQTLIDAVSEIKKAIPDIFLTVVGDGDMRRTYERRVAYAGLKSSVSFKGRLHSRALVHAYQHAHVLVSPSTNESFGMAILEAMSCGLPVVALDVGDVSNLVENSKSGYVMDRKELYKFTGSIHSLLTNKTLAKSFGRIGRAIARSKYNWDTKAKQNHRVLYQAIEKEKRKLLNVVHVVAYYPPHIGGMEQRVKELATFEAKKGLNVSVFTSDIGYKSGSYNQENVHVTYFSCLEIAHTPIPVSLVLSLVRMGKTDIIHLHVAQAFFPEIVAIVARLKKIPYIAHVRCLIIPSGIFGKLFLSFYNRHILAMVYRGATKVIVLTQNYVTILNKEYGVPLNRIVVIPNATTFQIAKTPRVQTCNPLRLLAVGRISVQKNYSFMLKVMERLKHMYNLNFVLTIIGPGEGIDQLRNEAESLGLNGAVRFIGGLGRNDVEKYYEKSDLLVHTSLIEGFGTIFIEAMAKGLPIVASNAIGTNNVVKNKRNGLLVPLSEQMVSRGIMKIIRDGQLYKKISAANLDDIQMYKWKNVLQKTLDVYENAAY